MSNRETAQATLGQVWELLGDIFKILGKKFSGLSLSQVQRLISNKKQLIDSYWKVALDILGEVEDVHLNLVGEWQRFYSEVLRITVDLSTLVIPPKPEGNWWLIVVVPGVTYNQIINMMRKLFQVWVWTDNLDKAVDMAKEQRQATDKPYAIWVRANVEADSDNSNKSANDLVNTPQITLMERLLLESVYFMRTGEHLDVTNVTLCAGSRGLVGRVPGVDWRGSGGELYIRYFDSGHSCDDLRSRSVS
ncbi:MAG: hypothetical protein WC705_03260 [Candidatus Paceibacterota bacterium]|jgi:hypothetical protein